MCVAASCMLVWLNNHGMMEMGRDEMVGWSDVTIGGWVSRMTNRTMTRNWVALLLRFDYQNTHKLRTGHMIKSSAFFCMGRSLHGYRVVYDETSPTLVVGWWGTNIHRVPMFVCTTIQEIDSNRWISAYIRRVLSVISYTPEFTVWQVLHWERSGINIKT